MKQITDDYFKLIEELNSKLQENDMIEILNVFDKIKLFWNKHKNSIMNEIKNKKETSAIIGGMTYPHFDENHHFIPLSHNNLLIVDEPISKMDEIVRASTINSSKKMLDTLQRTVDMFLESKDIILKNNIVIVPLRLYYGLDAESLRKQADKMVYSFLNYMFEREIESEKDIEQLSKDFDTFDKIDELIKNNKRDILYLGNDLVKFPINERIKQYYNKGALDFDKMVELQSPISLIIFSLYGYSAQISDIINTCEYTNSDLYLFIEIPSFYFNVLLENIFANDDELYDKYLKTIIGYYLQKCVNYYEYGNIQLADFCLKYKENNLINLLIQDFKINKCSKTPTDMVSIKKYIDIRVKEFLNIKE